MTGIGYPYIKNYTAATAVPKWRIVSPAGVVAGQVQLSVAPIDAALGIVQEVSPIAGERVDVLRHGPGLVEAGGVFAVGAPLASDAQGRAVEALPGAGVSWSIAGYAEQASLAVGDIVAMLVVPGRIKG